ncbi:hypothetical protein Dsin_018668 [Dipteronia sinensis]|uniref:DUF1985 domain-containing protein n=1 Tax=Dipteronia sinensis TaxID=43782 RepID=A0AAE0A6B1_9ROSI|nr:hypothetical protein Dsin_018668 [Dipteronia sinensis]
MVRFGKREFCLCTGLRFNRLSEIALREYEVVSDGIHARYFQGRKKVVIAELKAQFMVEYFERPHDALKLALVLFAKWVLFGQDDRNQVSYWLFSLVEDVKAFNNFEWGYYIFKMSLHYIHLGFKLTGILELLPTERELQKYYWRYIDVDLSEGPSGSRVWVTRLSNPTRGSAGQATDDDGGGSEVGDDDQRQDEQDWQDAKGCINDMVDDDERLYQKNMHGDDISDIDSSNLPIVLCADLSSLELAGPLEVALTPALAV